VNRPRGVIPQNEGQPTTAERLAKQHGVSRATIERDGQFAAAVEKVKAVDPAIRPTSLGDVLARFGARFGAVAPVEDGGGII